jgi:hypothetical protein
LEGADIVLELFLWLLVLNAVQNRLVLALALLRVLPHLAFSLFPFALLFLGCFLVLELLLDHLLLHLDVLFIFNPFFHSSLPLCCSVSEVLANEVLVLVSGGSLLSFIQHSELLFRLKLLFQCFLLPNLRVLHRQYDRALKALLVELGLLFLLEPLVLSLMLLWVTVLDNVGFLDHVGRFPVPL